MASLLEFVRTNSQLWETGYASQDTVNKRKEAIRELNTILVGDEEESMEYECSICLEKYIKDDVVKELECQHYFHESCILRWAETSSSCPFCRFHFHRDEEEGGAENGMNQQHQLDRVDLLREFAIGQGALSQEAQEQHEEEGYYDDSHQISNDETFMHENDYNNIE